MYDGVSRLCVDPRRRQFGAAKRAVKECGEGEAGDEYPPHGDRSRPGRRTCAVDHVS